MANLAEVVLAEQKNGFKKLVPELDEIVKKMCLNYGGCTLGYCGGENVKREGAYFSALFPEKYRRLAIEHYKSEGLSVTELFTPGGNFKGLKIDL